MTIVVGVMSKEGIVLAADGMTSGPTGVVDDTVKIVNLPPGSEFAVLVSGRGTFDEVEAVEKCSAVVEAQAVPPTSVADLNQMLFDYFERWQTHPGEANSFAAVCVGPGESPQRITEARFFVVFGSHGRPREAAQVRYFTDGSEGAQEDVLDYFEAQFASDSLLDGDWTRLDRALDRLALMPAAQVAEACQKAIEFAVAQEKSRESEWTIGGSIRTACLFLDRGFEFLN